MCIKIYIKVFNIKFIIFKETKIVKKKIKKIKFFFVI